MNSVVAVLIFVATALAVDYEHTLPDHVNDYLVKQGEQYKLYLQTSESITLTKEDKDEAFIGMNVVKPQETHVDADDLNVFYWYTDLKYAVVRTIKYLDDNNDKIIEKNELDNDFAKKAIRVALIECHYLKSKGLKQSCFADQLLTYTSLVLGKEDVNTFYKSIGGDDGISTEEAEKIQGPKGNKDPEGTAEELGAYHGGNGVTLDEFTDYVTQETVNDDFRRCRDGKPVVGSGAVNFDVECLKEELTEHTNDDLTEIDISLLYRAVDKDGNNKISKKEINEMTGVKGKPNEAELVKRIMNLLDMSLTTPKGTEAVIDYGEFRTYMRSPTVQLQAERECTENIDLQKDEIPCLFNLFVNLVTTNHDAIWFVVPDLEQQIAFEILDTNDNGKITHEELKFKNKEAKDRFFAELDVDESKYICLEEWNEYLDVPHMVYGTGDCLLETKDESTRGVCYPREVEDIIDNIRLLDDDFFLKWFKWYDADKNGVITANDNLHTKCGSVDLKDLFLDELGMGDRTVTKFEFKWYVKQQELADRYDAIITAGNKENHKEFNTVLINYIENDITEYDIQQFFRRLDGNSNHELEKDDFDTSTWAKVKELIVKIDAIDPHGDVDTNVNYREFWMWLNSEKVAGATPKVLVKDYFETKCTKEKKGKNQQEEEIKCYVQHFKEHSHEIYK